MELERCGVRISFIWIAKKSDSIIFCVLRLDEGGKEVGESVNNDALLVTSYRNINGSFWDPPFGFILMFIG